jgi:hypothetical protein
MFPLSLCVAHPVIHRSIPLIDRGSERNLAPLFPPRAESTDFGTFLNLFGGIAAIGVISIVGVREVRRWSGAVLAGAAVAWSLASTGTLIALFAGSALVGPGTTVAVGYWCLWASIVCVVVGTVTVLRFDAP